MVRVVKIPCIRGKIPWIVTSIFHGYRGQNTMGRRVKIPWIGVSKYHR
jgi:hypothetical protein